MNKTVKVLMIGTERRLFEEGSVARSRMLEYGARVGEIHVIIFSYKNDAFRPKLLGTNVWLYPTNSYNRWFFIFGVIRIIRSLSSRGITMVSTQDPFECGLAGFIASRVLNTPLQVQIHTDFLSPWFMRGSVLQRSRVFIGKKIITRADCTRVVSLRILESLIASGLRLRSAPVVLPIRPEVTNLLTIPRHSFLKDTYPHFSHFVLIVGRFEREKNISLALDVFASVSSQFLNVALVVVGDGSLQSQIKKKTKDLGIMNKVFFEGWRTELSNYYLSADVYLSTSDYEGYGLSVIEAASSGLPIVGTDTGAIREILGETLLLAPVRDKVALGKALSSVLANIEEAKRKASILRVRLPAILGSADDYFRRYALALEECSR